MKTGLTITEMAAEIERQAAAKADYLVNPLSMEMDSTGRVPMLRVTEGGVDQLEPLEIQETAHRQLGAHLNIPWKYYERMLQEEPGLLADNVNHWLHKGEPTQRLLRTIDGRARAFLSKAFMMKVQDTVKAAVDEARFTRVLDTMKNSTQAKLDTTDIPSVVKLTSNNFGLTETEGKGVLQHLLQDADYTLYGLANAVTRYSQDVEDYDRASKLEAIGYNVMTMTPAMFRQINQVASMAA